MPLTIEKAPGLCWRNTFGGRRAYWICNQVDVKSGFPISVQKLWRGNPNEQPSPLEMNRIKMECNRLQTELRKWRQEPRAKSKSKSTSEGFVYFVKSGDRIKIGFASNVIARLVTLRTGNPHGLELIGTIPARSREIERFLHWMFRDSRASNEWFVMAADLMAFIDKNVTPPKERHMNRSSKQFGVSVSKALEAIG